MDITNGFPIAQSPQGAAVAAPNGQRIGHVYTKAMFREFTDSSFVSQTDRPQVSKSLMLFEAFSDCDTVDGYDRTNPQG